MSPSMSVTAVVLTVCVNVPSSRSSDAVLGSSRLLPTRRTLLTGSLIVQPNSPDISPATQLAVLKTSGSKETSTW